MIIYLLFPLLVIGHPETTSDRSFSLGIRTTASYLEGWGTGIGGEFNISLSNAVNTEWYADYIYSDIEGLGKRIDYHIGWSVQYLPVSPSSKDQLEPFVEAGHCFDWTTISAYEEDLSASRFSSAVQFGGGVKYLLEENLELGLKAQYMIHLGKDLHADVHADHFHIHESEGSELESHILFSFTINYILSDLW